MPVVKCSVKDCAYCGRECCTADRILVDADGQCLTQLTYAELMRQLPNERKRPAG